MAELLECLVCGYKTVRCGMTNHLKTQHPKEYEDSVHGRPIRDALGTNGLTKSLGQVKNWSQDRNQKPVKTET